MTFSLEPTVEDDRHTGVSKDIELALGSFPSDYSDLASVTISDTGNDLSLAYLAPG